MICPVCKENQQVCSGYLSVLRTRASSMGTSNLPEVFRTYDVQIFTDFFVMFGYKVELPDEWISRQL